MKIFYLFINLKEIDWATVGGLGGLISLGISLLPYIKEYLYKADLKISLDKNVEIDTGEFNSVFSIRALLHTVNKDVFINSIIIYMKHESGSEKIYEWQTLIENVSVTKMNDIVIPTDKFYRAIGYKTFKDQTSSVAITFSFSKFKDIYEEVSPKLYELRYKLKKEDKSLKAIEEDSNFLKLIDSYKTTMAWSSGKYNCVLQFSTPNEEVFREKFSFIITEDIADSINNFAINKAIYKSINNFARDEDNKEKRDYFDNPDIPNYITVKTT